MDSSFYISRGKGTQGPFTLGELQTYLAYGSIAEMDLVLRDGTEEWIPVSSLPELVEAEPATSSGRKGTKKALPRRRIARYREYSRVPVPLRSGTVIRQLIFGMLFWPPTLWKAGSSIFSSYIYRHAKDDAGYLRIWPRSVEPVVSVMIVINILVWLGAAIWITQSAGPVLSEVFAVLREGLHEFESWLSTGP